MVSNVLDGHTAHDHTHGRDYTRSHVHHHDAADTEVFGLWVCLTNGLITFALLSATFCVLCGTTADGPTGKELFDLSYVAIEAGTLPVSSIACNMVMVSLQGGRKDQIMLWLNITLVLGIAFVGTEINEFHHLITEDTGPNRSAFLSSFSLLVGTRGLHVASDMLRIIVLMW